jgi:transcriptional regulator with XRE-family HTH domain
MGTTQSAVSRAESGWVAASAEFIERFARAVGTPITITFGQVGAAKPSRSNARKRVRRATGGYRFDPWLRSPTPAEARSLEADGLSRERFARETHP